MSYIFESKRDLLYFKNYIALKQVLEQAGGDGQLIIKKLAEDLLGELARNRIELNPRYLEANEQTK